MLGIYAGMVPVAVAAATTGSMLMMSTLTSAIALTMAGTLAETSFTTDQVTQAVVTMALLAGVIMAVLGVLKLGKVVNYVSNAVMTGFVMGVAILIMVGKADDIFGYDPSTFSNKVLKAGDILVHPGSWELATTAVGVGTILLAFAFKAIPQLERYALVLVVGIGTLVVWVLSIDTALISDSFTIPTGLAALPIPTSLADLPDLEMMPTLLVGSASIAIVALAQGAGIRPAFPNPDGSRSDASRDFLGAGPGQRCRCLLPGGAQRRLAVAHGRECGRRGHEPGCGLRRGRDRGPARRAPRAGRRPDPGGGHRWAALRHRRRAGDGAGAGCPPGMADGQAADGALRAALLLTLTVHLQWAIIGAAVLSLAAFVIDSGSHGA